MQHDHRAVIDCHAKIHAVCYCAIDVLRVYCRMGEIPEDISPSAESIAAIGGL